MDKREQMIKILQEGVHFLEMQIKAQDRIIAALEKELEKARRFLSLYRP